MTLKSSALIWFGAGVSLAEILTGVSFAALGFGKGFLAITVGHIIGCFLLFVSGVIGGKSRKNAMDTVKMSFGGKGTLLFSSLNVAQLVGWTAIMIVSGASAANLVCPMPYEWLWSIIIGALIIVWISADKNLDKLNILAMSLLFILTVFLAFEIFMGDNNAELAIGEITFGQAVELSVAMPLSWLPLISDYTSEAKEPVKASAVSAVVYFFVSSFMYVIGMGMAIFTGESDIAVMLSKSSLGVFAILIVIFSTVTTTYLDAYSAGVSINSINKKANIKHWSILVAVIGTILAVFAPVNEFESFLYFIGSVFAPMIAIQLADFFVLRRNCENKGFSIVNLAIWLVGFLIYRIFMNIDFAVGCTLPAMIATFLLALLKGR
ncbi:MAG: putative hydroxymethylpyrimidine transporter CytX [Clostridia bacterium]|nr:putative hydroxymethylpyrimidine transporter CytX [Clostridia bacterium]